jgi:hypothetical protein
MDPFRVAADAPPATTPASTPAPAAPAAVCQKDEDCPEKTICDAGSCQPIRPRTNIFFLYYKEEAFTEILLVYWNKKGPQGYTVFFPFYWHFWGPKSETTVIVPVLPISWSKGPDYWSFGVWPFVYASNKFGWAAPLLGTFKVADPDNHSSFGAVAFLYWWKRSPAHAFDIAVPLFASSRRAEKSFTWALPLNFYWRTGNDRSLLALPFFYASWYPTGGTFATWLGYKHRNGPNHSASLLWLYWGGGNDEDKTAYDVLFPLLWSFRSKGGHSTVFFPFLWDFRSGSSRTTVMFPFLALEEGPSYFATGFPFWWSGGDRSEGREFRTLLPIFYWQRDAKAKTAFLLTPVGGYSRDDTAGTRTWFALPFFLSHSDKESETRVFSPLYISYRSKPEQSITRLITLFYRREDPEGSTTTVFPLFWHFHDALTDARATVLLPIFLRRSGPRDTTTFVGPLYWRSFKNGGWSGGLFPIAWFGSNAERTHAVVFPVYWHYTNARAESATTAVFPLFSWHRDRHGYSAAFLPLLFIGKKDGDSWAVQFPLLFHFASAQDGTSGTITPLGFYQRDSDGWSLGVGPLIPLVFARSGEKRSHFALVPLIWHFRDRDADRNTTVVGLYMHRRWGNETTDALFPLIYYRRGARPGAGEETSFTLFPFVHYRRNATTRVLVTPIGGSTHGPNRAAGFLGPYFWYEDKAIAVRFIPLLHADITNRVTGERTRQYGPWFQTDAPDHWSRAFFPVFGVFQDDRERDLWVFPTFFRMRRKDGDRIDAFLPVYWRSSLGGKETTVVGPYYDRTAPGIHNNGLVPIFFHARNPERSLTVIPPLLYAHKAQADGSRDWRWCALYYQTREGNDRSTTLFPFYWSSTYPTKRHRVVFPLYWHFENDELHTKFTMLGPLMSATTGNRKTKGLLPFAWFTRDGDTGEKTNAFVPLFYQTSGRDQFTLLTIPAGYRRKGPSTFWYALPFVLRNRDEITDTTTTVIPPLILYSYSTPEEGFTAALLLYWHRRDIASSTTMALPLFYDVHDYRISRTTVLLPFFLRYERMADQNTYWFAPLFYRHSSPTDATTVVFPLVWDFKRGADRTTVVAPFYAHWKRPDHTGTYVFPIYYYREGLRADGNPDGTYRRFVIPFYDSGVKRPGDFMWEILGGLVGHERIGHHRYLRIFYMTFETAPAPRAQTAWYSKPPPTSRKTAARGLDVMGF